MKFVYQYRTSDNVQHEGTILASDRESAFRLLKAQGVRPVRMEEAPGLLNKLFGKGKRWLAIAVLLVVIALISALLLRTHETLVETKYEIDRAQEELRFATEDRAQLFGDPFILRKLSADGWRTSFPNEGDAWFARHAQPGVIVPLSDEKTFFLSTNKVAILDDDSEELKKMKRMVNAMKLEFGDYLEAGGSQEEFVKDCDERLRVERTIYEGTLAETKILESRLAKGEPRTPIEAEWDKKNATLRSMGIMTIPMPE